MKTLRGGTSRLLPFAAVACVSVLSTRLQAESPSTNPVAPPRVPIDLVLVIDTSGSMSGAGGSPVIFPAVQNAARQLIDWCEQGDNVVLVSYDATVNLRPPVAIYGPEDKARLKEQIGAVRAKGLWTYTALALQDALAEAKRLDDEQGTEPAKRHTKIVVLMTDGKNDPPPSARNAGVSLQEVGRRFQNMPWFVWQIQLGPEVDRGVEKALSERIPAYRTVPDPGARNLFSVIRDEVIKKVEEGARKARDAALAALKAQEEEARRRQKLHVSVAPTRVSFDPLRPGATATRELRLAAAKEGQPGTVQLRNEALPEGIKLVLQPSRIDLTAGSTLTVRLTLSSAKTARPGEVRTSVHLSVVQGQVLLEPADIPVSGAILTPSKAWIYWLGAVLLGLVFGLAVLLARRPRVQGTLRYWMPGVAPQQIDLTAFQKRRLRIGSDAASDIVLPDFSGKGAAISVARLEGVPVCVLQPDPGTTIQFRGSVVSDLSLYDRDQFQLEKYAMQYRGEVPERPPV